MRPGYTSTISTSYSKQQHETYLQLDCGLAKSNAPAKHPILFHRSRLLCPLSPCRERQAGRASHEQTSQQRANETICAAYFLSAALSKYPSRRSPASNALTLSWFGLVYLQTSVSPVRISLRHVAHLQHTKQATR